MLRAYRREDCRLVPTELDLTPHSIPADAAGALWGWQEHHAPAPRHGHVRSPDRLDYACRSGVFIPRRYRALNRLRARHRLLVVLGVVLGGLVPMMGRMQSVRVRDVGVMPGLLVIAGFIVLGGFAMMVGSALVVIGGGLVMLATLVRLCAHGAVLLFGCADGEETATEV